MASAGNVEGSSRLPIIEGSHLHKGKSGGHPKEYDSKAEDGAFASRPRQQWPASRGLRPTSLLAALLVSLTAAYLLQICFRQLSTRVSLLPLQLRRLASNFPGEEEEDFCGDFSEELNEGADGAAPPPDGAAAGAPSSAGNSAADGEEEEGEEAAGAAAGAASGQWYSRSLTEPVAGDVVATLQLLAEPSRRLQQLLPLMSPSHCLIVANILGKLLAFETSAFSIVPHDMQALRARALQAHVFLIDFLLTGAPTSTLPETMLWRPHLRKLQQMLQDLAAVPPVTEEMTMRRYRVEVRSAQQLCHWALLNVLRSLEIIAHATASGRTHQQVQRQRSSSIFFTEEECAERKQSQYLSQAWQLRQITAAVLSHGGQAADCDHPSLLQHIQLLFPPAQQLLTLQRHQVMLQQHQLRQQQLQLQQNEKQLKRLEKQLQQLQQKQHNLQQQQLALQQQQHALDGGQQLLLQRLQNELHQDQQQLLLLRQQQQGLQQQQLQLQQQHHQLQQQLEQMQQQVVLLQQQQQPQGSTVHALQHQLPQPQHDETMVVQQQLQLPQQQQEEAVHALQQQQVVEMQQELLHPLQQEYWIELPPEEEDQDDQQEYGLYSAAGALPAFDESPHEDQQQDGFSGGHLQPEFQQHQPQQAEEGAAAPEGYWPWANEDPQDSEFPAVNPLADQSRELEDSSGPAGPQVDLPPLFYVPDPPLLPFLSVADSAADAPAASGGLSASHGRMQSPSSGEQQAASQQQEQPEGAAAPESEEEESS
ncbi:hypothetical protein Efla_006709 [Eimeria flavescens]